MDREVLALGTLTAVNQDHQGLDTQSSKEQGAHWRRKTQTINQAGFIESLGEGQDPGVKATKGQSLAQ